MIIGDPPLFEVIKKRRNKTVLESVWIFSRVGMLSFHKAVDVTKDIGLARRQSMH